jgi:hypothetical protein
MVDWQSKGCNGSRKVGHESNIMHTGFIGRHLVIIAADKIDLNVIARLIIIITAGIELQTSGYHAVSSDCRGSRSCVLAPK